MLRSLVGSEMCIRDRYTSSVRSWTLPRAVDSNLLSSEKNKQARALACQLKAGRHSAVAFVTAHSLETALREKLSACRQRSERRFRPCAEGQASVLANCPPGQKDWVKPVPLRRGHVGFEHARAWLDRFSQFLDPLRVLGNLPTCLLYTSPSPRDS